MTGITSNQLAVLHHTLGLRPNQRNAYRNHFVAGHGHHDKPHLEALVSAGLMVRVQSPGFLGEGDEVFACTSAGKEYAEEHLPMPPPPPKLTKFDEFQDADTGYSFAEYLGIRKPEYEYRRSGKRGEYRMFRREYDYSRDVEGEWAPTKKAAKASYKAALQAYKEAQS